MNNPSPPPPPEKGFSSPALVIFAWLFVGLPLAWGVTQTLFKAMALFH